ncbi:uncharacterized protein BT62DRAFT_1010233 [Guyanagaster necrorhizus]|uniref:Uncharacterized protein n=1 Tax=Guyanagaster necrorhizus TaxID=856835 RepID=A0A9P7VL41_9AGAR|nr:uncharacterized protein BT62DRAFT_1010233 [Guyanagaster necrorhizus MCA 3950]KAG7442622.1 hypothetical protein BT62DRAFT_1010233 [Guyanagaster necrorhizus MCA 3950]
MQYLPPHLTLLSSSQTTSQMTIPSMDANPSLHRQSKRPIRARPFYESHRYVLSAFIYSAVVAVPRSGIGRLPEPPGLRSRDSSHGGRLGGISLFDTSFVLLGIIRTRNVARWTRILEFLTVQLALDAKIGKLFGLNVIAEYELR